MSQLEFLTSSAAFISILAAVLTTMIAVGVDAKTTEPDRYSLWPRPHLEFRVAFSAVGNIVFAYGMWL